MSEESETMIGAHGTAVSDRGSETYELLRRKGADVSPYPVGAGGRPETQRPLMFRAFEMLPASEGGGMVRTTPFGPDNPAPLLDPSNEVQPAPPQVSAPLSAQISGSVPVRTPVVTKHVTFINTMGEFEFDCYSITEQEHWLTLIGPKFPKIPPDTTIDLKIDGQTRSCYAPGINVEIELCGTRASIAHFMIAPK